MRRLTNTLALAGSILAASASAVEFDGWEGIRVAEQKGASRVLRSFDATLDGIDDVVVVNPRYSRLDVYSYRAPEGRTEQLDGENLSDPEDANFLPLAIELKHSKIQLEQIPMDVVAIKRGGVHQLAVLVAGPARLLFMERDKESLKWTVAKEFDLLGAKATARHKAMQLLPVRDAADPQLMIACEDGYLTVTLGDEISSQWLQPREERTLLDWWLTDVDGDGKQDILEQRRSAEEAICWLQGDGEGSFQPARTLHDRLNADVRVLSGFERTPVVVLDERAEGMVRRFAMDFTEESTVGRQLPLPIENGTVWSSLNQGDEKVLVTASKSSPLLETYSLTEDGWKAGATFPTLGNVVKLVQPAATPGQLLLWCKDAAQLYSTKWDGNRLSYPKIMESDTTLDDDAKILALGKVGDTTWWATQNGRDILLNKWSASAEKPETVTFDGVGSSVEEVLWIGDNRLLAKERRARGLVLFDLPEGETKPAKSEPTALQRAEVEEFRVYDIGGEVKVGRLTDGVLQWLDEELEPFEQVMLGDSQEIADFLPDSLSSGWAVDAANGTIHLMKPDETGVSKEEMRYELAGTESITRDAVLGLLSVGRDSIVSLSDGKQEELKQVEALTPKSRRGAAGKGDCDRFLVADLDLDGKDELLLCDDGEHNLTAMKLGDTFEKIASWKVFEDMTYPYGGDDFGDDGAEREPRAVASMDLDGDKAPDLAMLCHDRLVIYFGKDPK